MRRARDFAIIILSVAVIALMLGNGVVKAAEPDGMVDSFFDVFNGIPGPGTSTGVDTNKSSSPLDKLFSFEIGVGDLGPAGVPIFSETTDSGGPEGSPGQVVNTSLSLPSGDFAVDSFFDIAYEVLPLPEKPVADLKLPDEPFWGDSFFDITYEIDFADNSFQIINLHGEIEPGQQILINNIAVGDPDFPADSFFDVFFDLDIPDPVQIDPALPFMNITMTGTYTVPEPVSLALLGLGGMLAAVYRKKTSQ